MNAWSRYRDVVVRSDFIFAFLTLGLTLISWGMYLAGGPEPLVRWTGIAGGFVGGVPIAYGAIRGLIAREMNVDELVSIAIIASLVAGEYWSAGLVAFMMLFGKVLEDVTAARAQHAIEGLGQLVPDMAQLKEADGSERTAPVAEVRPGDIVFVRPGERLPVDGEVVAGHAAVEEAAITGEPLPVDKALGDTVYAGTLTAGGTLEVRATRTGEATALGRIAALVKEAEAERAPIVRAADRWATWFTPAVLALAALVYLWQRDFLPALTVLVVACPCALVLATPTAVIAGIARGTRSGILIKGGARLEAAGHVDAVCLDKTGTLTLGKPMVQRVVVLPESGVSEDELLALAAAAERFSEHPLGRAIFDSAASRDIVVPTVDMALAGFRAVPGKGVSARIPSFTGASGTVAESPAGRPGGGAGTLLVTEAARTSTTSEVIVGRPEFLIEQRVEWSSSAEAAVADLEREGQTAIVVAINGSAAGVISLADEIRQGSAVAVQALRTTGLRRLVVLTGDREASALAVARAVGIPAEDVHAGLLPEGKVAVVKQLRETGHRVAMIGDGVNDAPALAAADVAIAMGAAGTDVALQAADIALMTDDIRQAASAIALSRHTVSTIKQNLGFAVVWNVIALILAATGIVGPVAGALVHNVGSVAVVLNAARLINAKLR
jgi:heavy metal translocating P-type ATPase